MSDGDYGKDREFGDSLMAEVKAIIGQYLFRDNLTEEDCERNTDLFIPEITVPRVAVRIRRHSYLERYGDEFTIRYDRETDAKTEFEKIMEGYGDIFFYGFKDESGRRLEKWIIGSLQAFRSYICGQMQNDWESFLRTHKHVNAGGRGSAFLSFKAEEIPEFIMETSEDPKWKVENAWIESPTDESEGLGL